MKPGLIGRRLLALGCAAACLYALRFYPPERTWLLPVLAIYAGLLIWRQHMWLFALPALLPTFDLAPWTGWFFFEEIDLLLLITAAAVYWRPARATGAGLPSSWLAGLLLLSSAVLLGLWRGLQPMPPLDANALNNYLSPYNALRVAKPWCWALLLLQPMRAAAGPDLDGLHRLFLPGMLCGLALVAGADIWERLVFPGLLNFSSDYRTSAPFSAMHTGGAALDAYLALTFPLSAMYLLQPSPWWCTVPAVTLLALASYAGLSTFSRDVFLAYASSVLVITGFLLQQRQLRQAQHWRRVASGLALAVVAIVALTWVFSSGGYRSLGSALLLMVGAVVFSTVPASWRPLPAVLTGIVLLELMLTRLWPEAAAGTPLKPPYFFFGAFTLLFICSAFKRHTKRHGTGWQLSAIIGMALNYVWIGWHRAGAAACLPNGVWLLLCLLIYVLNRTARPAYWQFGRSGMILLAVLLLLCSTAIPIVGSDYAGARLSGSQEDLQYRWRHWQHVLAMMDDDLGTTLFGMGLGRYPAIYYWRNPLHEQPGAYRYLDEHDNRYLRLIAADYPAGYGEMLRMLQYVRLTPDTPYLLELDVRDTAGPAFLHVNLCERWLLYPRGCVAAPLRLLPPGPGWHHYLVPLASGALGRRSSWLLRPPVQLELALEGPQAVVDIDNVSLREAYTRRDQIRNGSFSEANNYWFFSSDRHHLPWHVKNLPLYLYFELGWFGLLAWCLLLASALLHLCRRAWAGQVQAAVWLASLAGFLAVGCFDSVLEVPRLTLLLLLVLAASQMRPASRSVQVAQ